MSLVSWAESLRDLKSGNQRFRSGLRSVESFASTLRLREFAEKGQSPSAVILTCSDSRVPTEILFDRGVGDLFVIRIAGNIVSSMAIASIEYAALVLKTPICIVMGHSQCGAIRAAISKMKKESTPESPHIEHLLNLIIPSAQEEIDKDEAISDSKLEDATILNNIYKQVALIKEQSTAIQKLISQDTFQVMGALYNLNDGEVNFDLPKINSISERG